MARWLHHVAMKNVMMFKNVFVLGGTTEARKIISFVRNYGIQVTVSVATTYGEELLEEEKDVQVLQQRLDESGFEALFKKQQYDLVIDATHPYAKEATQNCKKACEKLEMPYKRIVREEVEHRILRFSSVEEIISYLENTQGNILLTTGSKDLQAYTKLTHFKERIYIRMLPMAKSIDEQLERGYLMSHLICMQGPFSLELNKAMLNQIQARYMVTKDSGTVGGMEEKVEAARQLGVTLLCLRRPDEEGGMSLQQFYKWFEEVKHG